MSDETRPEAIADTEILYEPHQEIYLDSGFHQHFMFLCWKKTTTKFNFTTFARFLKPNSI